MKLTPVVVLLLAPACSTMSNENKSDLESQAEHVSDCCKLEGPEIGREDALLRLGSKAVLVHDWVGKKGEAGEYIGFSLTIDGASSMSYVVKAGTERIAGSGTPWMHPSGEDGAGISNLDFCDECDDPDGCDNQPPTNDPPEPDDDGSGPVL